MGKYNVRGNLKHLDHWIVRLGKPFVWKQGVLISIHKKVSTSSKKNLGFHVIAVADFSKQLCLPSWSFSCESDDIYVDEIVKKPRRIETAHNSNTRLKCLIWTHGQTATSTQVILSGCRELIRFIFKTFPDERRIHTLVGDSLSNENKVSMRSLKRSFKFSRVIGSSTLWQWSIFGALLIYCIHQLSRL